MLRSTAIFGNEIEQRNIRCGPVSYDIDDEKLQSSGKGEIRLSKEEPKCMQKNLRVSADARSVLCALSLPGLLANFTVDHIILFYSA